MRAEVKAVTPDEYEAWAQQRADDIEAAGKALGEQRKSGEGAVIPK
jgi:heme/copper-type cytochrome/quinol oxidase subunit 2